MRLLIAYDGSPSANAAIDDLQKAGLPHREVEAVILSVAEVWLPPPNGNGFDIDNYPEIVKKLTRERLKIVMGAVDEAKTLCRHAREKVEAQFPLWAVSSETTDGSPAWEILARADSFKPDLIVLGSQGQTAVSRILLGSISQKVMTEAKCSVRIARGKEEIEHSSIRILIGFDGSMGSNLAVEQVAARNWSEGSEAYLVTATHPLLPTAIGRFVPPVKEGRQIDSPWIEAVAEPHVRKLENAGLSVKLKTIKGNPKQVLVEYAAKWQADSIFIGAHSYSILERFLIGSTSLAVSERAGCSVEIARPKSN